MIRVLPAKPKDLARLTEIFKQAALYKHRYNDYSWRDGFSKKGAKGMIDRGDTYTVYVDNELIATVGLEWKDDAWSEKGNDQAGYIHRLAIADDFHGKQLGKQIIDWAAGEVANRQRKYLRLDCNVANSSLCAYYENHGFKQVATKEFPDYNYTAALYERSV